jgi:hypothetical protein
LRNYADEVIRQKRAVDFPGANIPPHEKPPFDRDTGFLIGSQNLPNIAKVILFSRLSVNIDKPARNGERILDMSALTDEVAATKLPQWQAVGLVLDQNARDLRAKRYGRLQEVISWFKAMELFRQAENERLIERKPTPADKRYHKTWLAALISEGERLLTELRRNGGLARNQAGIKLSDIQATLEELYDTQSEWYGGLSAERRTALFKELFDGPQS